MRSMILGSLFVLSIILHIGTISMAGVASVVSGLFEGVTGLGTVLGGLGEGLLETKAKLATTEADLATAKAKNTQLSGELDTAKKKTASLDVDLQGTNKKNAGLLQEVAELKGAKLVTYRGNPRLIQDAVKDTSSRISRRTATGASRNLAATVGEAWPVAGIAVIATATALELHDACVIMQDLHELDVAFNPEVAFGTEAYEVCGMRVPTKQELLDAVGLSGWEFRAPWN